MTDKTRQSQVFDFFHLPRELRDEVYINLATDITLVSGSLSDGARRGIQVLVGNGPVPKLLRLNHQFKDEYGKQIERMQVLTFKDLGGTLTQPSQPIANAQPSIFTKVELNLLALCTPDTCTAEWCDGAEDISTHIIWTNNTLTNLTRLEEVVIRLYVHWKADGEPKWPHAGHGPGIYLQLNNLVKTSRLSRLEVYPFYWNEDYDDTVNRVAIYKKHEDLVALWTKEEGWVEA